MKRQKGNSSEQKSIKRQKSHIDDKLSGIENTPDDEQLECANLQAENGKALVDNHQDVASNLQRDDVDGRYLDGTATNEAHKSEQKRSVERNEQVDDAKRSTCGKPRVIKSENNGGKSRPGFGFTRDTEQYRSLENRQSSTDFRRETRSTNRNVKKKCEGRTNPGNKKIENNFPRFDAKYAELKPSVIPSGKCLYKTVNKGPTFDADDTEMDSIFTCKTTVKTLEHAPKQAPVDYADMCPKSLPPKHSMIMCMIPTGQKPDEETDILIPHPKADRPEGDVFGAKLCTYLDKHKPKYHRHFLIGDITGPAEEMGIRKKDELVLIEEIFVPDLSHADVLNLFYHVKVDSKTRFSLVVRRVVNKKWHWIETSAVLAPDPSPDKSPVIKRAEYKRLKEEAGVVETSTSRHIYKASGTHKYLEIIDKNVRIDIFKWDNTDSDKIIVKRQKILLRPGIHMDYEASLCDKSMTRYIGMDKKSNIVLKNEPEWFKPIYRGSLARFQLKDQYLGYDRESGEVKAQQHTCEFEEFQASDIEELKAHATSMTSPSVGIDQVDGHFRSHDSSVQEMDVDVPKTMPGYSEADTESKQSSFFQDNTCTLLNDGVDSAGNSSPRSNEDLSGLSQSSNDSNKSAFDMYGNASLGADSSGYSSLHPTPPDSFDFSADDDLDISGLDDQNCFKMKNNPKTPTTPMINLSLSESLVQH